MSDEHPSSKSGHIFSPPGGMLARNFRTTFSAKYSRRYWKKLAIPIRRRLCTSCLATHQMTWSRIWNASCCGYNSGHWQMAALLSCHGYQHFCSCYGYSVDVGQVVRNNVTLLLWIKLMSVKRDILWTTSMAKWRMCIMCFNYQGHQALLSYVWVCGKLMFCLMKHMTATLTGNRVSIWQT